MYTNFQPPNVTKRKLAPCLCTYWFCLRLTNTKREIEYFGFINQAQEYKCYFFSINLLLTIFQLSFKLTNDTVQFYNTTLYLATSPPKKTKKSLDCFAYCIEYAILKRPKSKTSITPNIKHDLILFVKLLNHLSCLSILKATYPK